MWPPKAAFAFGHAVEASVVGYYKDDGDPAQIFKDEWVKSREKKLEYGKSDKDWQNLLAVGSHLMRLFKAIAPGLGIVKPKFYDWKSRITSESGSFLEKNYLEVIPDIIDWPAEHKRWGEGPRSIDIKTSDKAYLEEPEGIIAMDEQLRVQAWASKVKRVAFLVFVKGSPGVVAKKNAVYTVLTAMKDSSGKEIFKTGDQIVCAEVPKKKAEKSALKDNGLLLAHPKGCVAGVPVPVPIAGLTGTRIQLLEGRIEPDDSEGVIALYRDRAKKMGERWELYEEERIKISTKLPKGKREALEQEALAKAYPQNSGFRFPNQRCPHCPMLGLCMGDEKLVKERIRKRDETWLEELE